MLELPKPLGLLAELTHRCPLGCPYCSNPLAMDSRNDELDAGTWSRVFKEAAALGVCGYIIKPVIGRTVIPEIENAFLRWTQAAN